jgi:GGDEF domain-containing protein
MSTHMSTHMDADWYFEDFFEGQDLDLGSRTLSEEEIIAFATQFDPQPFHVDKEAAAASIYGGVIASGVARRLMSELELMAIPHAASPTAPHLTVSMGIACMVPGEHSFPADLVQVADALLYQAKSGGRNRYRANAGCGSAVDTGL